MDSILSEFITRTSADPGLATDLLNAHEWDLQHALSSYYVMKGILPGEVPISHEPFKPNPASSNCVQKQISSKEKNTQPDSNDSEDITDEEDIVKKLSRGFSRAMDNLGLISRARCEFAQDFGTFAGEDASLPTKLEIPDYTFTLPNLSVYHPSLREYLQKDLIETSTLVSLEQAGRLNWWHTKKVCQKLWPLATTGDGNCLLHAASLGMWGFHDRLLTLRKALHGILTGSPFTGAFYRRWRWQTALQNKEAGLIYCEEEWEKEWQNLLKMSSTEPRTKHLQNNGSESSMSLHDANNEKLSNVYESLEELHVFGLAHVLMRPIIVIADTMLKDVSGEPFAPIPFGGIYLPLECQPSECHRSPLCLTYDAAHFSALVPMDLDPEDPSTVKAAIPVLSPDHALLPLHFAVDPGSQVQWDHDENDPWVVGRLNLMDKDKLLLLNEYLDIRSLPVTFCNENCMVEPSKTINNYVTENKQELRYDSDDDRSGGISCTGSRHNKSKAARQLQTVAKQFGSIGKSVSKKLKHIGDIARRGGSFKGDSKTLCQASDDLKNKHTLSGFPIASNSTISVNGNCNPHQVIVALLNTEKRHEYQNEMIQNYLCSAVLRFEQNEVSKANTTLKSNSRASTPAMKCIDPNCLMYGSSATSYLCSTCYIEHKENELKLNGNKKNGLGESVLTFGKSSFYTESDKDTVESLDKVPFARGFSGKSYLRWHGSDFYDKCPPDTRTRPSTFPYDYKRKPLCLDDTVMLNTLQESASS